MDWLHLVTLLAVLGPLYFIAHLERTRLKNPRYVRQSGVAVEREAILVDDQAQLLGYYDGCEIRSAVVYLGIRYRFECVVPASYRRQLLPGELYVEPGLLYVLE